MSWNHRIINNKTIIALFILVIFYILGCSTYSIPSESKVIIDKKDLATFNPKNFPSKENTHKKLTNEDQLIIQAIFLEEQGAYAQSMSFMPCFIKQQAKKSTF